MQKQFKYKNYTKIRYYNLKFPLKLLAYHSQKWKKLGLEKKIKFKTEFNYISRFKKKKNYKIKKI